MIFTLTLTLDAAGVATINAAGQAVTLVQSVTSLVQSGAQVETGEGPLPLAWLVFAPLENNTVSWTGQYSLYATSTPLTLGAVVAVGSATSSAAQLGWTYTFRNGVFTGSSGTGACFIAANQEQATYSFGLFAQATINAAPMSGPLDAIPVLFDEESFFSLPSALSIFLSSASSNGEVLPEVPGNALTLDLTSGTVAWSVCFNDSTNVFYLCS